MKTIKELQTLLISEINKNLKNVRSAQNVDYYNSLMGDTSILLTSIMEEHLLKMKDWDNTEWLDDCLLEKVGISSLNDEINIEGIMIWGKKNTSEQWVSPFVFKLKLDKSFDSNKYSFLYGDLDMENITYEDFRNNRHYFEKKDRNWKYIINSDEI